MTTPKTATREQWLKEAILALTPLFKEKGYAVPKCHVSCGFASTDVKRRHIGQCWSTKASADKVNQIFISPGLSDSVEVLDTLMHELLHAVDDCQNKHGPVFKKMALKLGMKGPMRSAGAGPELKIKLEQLIVSLGTYPHAKLNVPRKVIDHRPRPRAKCSECGFTVPMLKAFMHYGPPICPKDKIDMIAIGDWK
ncbi:MAG: sprT domain-containing protein [Alcaligenaceae bacterium]|nr:MAG: sprT domain-containing protein [Alcaligenaceae bacterium]